MADADDDLDPTASTQMFQAFVDRHRDEPEPRSPWPWVAAVVVVLAIVIVGALWFLLG